MLIIFIYYIKDKFNFNNMLSPSFQGPSFTCPIIERKNSTSSSLSSSSAAAAEDITDSACSGALNLNSVERFYPESDETAEERLRKAERLRRANERWRDAYGEVTFEGCEDDDDEEEVEVDNRVKFSEPETWAVHLEDPALAAELKEARMSDFIRRQSDRERLSRIISPVLQSKHRKEVYERIYGGGDVAADSAATSLIHNNASSSSA